MDPKASDPILQSPRNDPKPSKSKLRNDPHRGKVIRGQHSTLRPRHQLALPVERLMHDLFEVVMLWHPAERLAGTIA